jgi:hypothetical protein
MPQGKDIEIFLQDKLNRFWHLTETGEVTLDANAKPIVFSPDGWQDLGIKNVRNNKYWALDRTVTVPFKYTEDGAKILKHIFYKLGSEESVYLTICEQRLDYDGTTYGYWYKQIFKGEIDFSTFDHDGATVTVNTVEEGLAKFLRANENEAYEFDLSAAEKVKMDGILLKNKMSFSINGIPDKSTGFSGGWKDLSTVSASLIVREGPSSGIAVLSQEQEQIDGSISSAEYMEASENYLFKNTAVTPVTLEISGKVKLLCVSRVGSVKISINFAIDGSVTTYDIFNNVPLNGGVTYEQDFTFSIPLTQGQKLFLFTFFDNSGGGLNLANITFQDTQMTADYQTRFATTYIPFLRPQYLFSEFIYRMTGGAFTAEDCPYFGALQNIDKVFTSGDGIRGIANAKLKMSFNDFFGFFNTWHAGSVGIRERYGKVLFDRKKNLVNYADVLQLGEISRPKIKFNKDFGFNQLSVGYKDEKNENGLANGKNEFNTTFNFSLGTTKNPRKLELISPIQGSCYAIEGIRVDTFLKDTTDNKGDNQSYVLHVEKTLIVTSDGNPNHYKLNRDRNAFITGVDQVDTVFNAGISPKSCFLNGGDFLRSSLYKMDNRTFVFGTADRNTDMSYVNGSDVIVEKADVPVNSLEDKFFVPVDIDIETDAPVDILDLLDADPLLIMEATCEGRIIRGLPQEVSINPRTGKIQTYKLLATADMDFEPFIDYYG